MLGLITLFWIRQIFWGDFPVLPRAKGPALGLQAPLLRLQGVLLRICGAELQLLHLLREVWR